MAGKYGSGPKSRNIPRLKNNRYDPSKSYLANIKLLNDVIVELKEEFRDSKFDISFIFAIGISSHDTKYTEIRFIRCQGFLDTLIEVVKRLIAKGKSSGKSH